MWQLIIGFAAGILSAVGLWALLRKEPRSNAELDRLREAERQKLEDARRQDVRKLERIERQAESEHQQRIEDAGGNSTDWIDDVLQASEDIIENHQKRKKGQ